MIDKITREQEAQIPNYVEKWLKVALCTDRVDRGRAKEVSDFYYEKILNKKKVPVLVLDSPLSMWADVCLLSVEDQVWNQFWNQVRNQVWNQVGNQVKDQIRDQIRDQVRNQVWNQVGNQVRNQFWDQFWNQFWNQIRSQVRNQVKDQIRDFIYPYIDGHLAAGYFSFYDFMEEVLGVKYSTKEKYDWYKGTSEIGLFYPLENICIISDRPSKINMKNGILHSDTDYAVEYVDGFSFYCLNGVKVPEWLVKTPKHELRAGDLLTNKDLKENVEIRREFVRKIGVERCITQLGWKVLDAVNTYELGQIDVVGTPRKYLKMLNPSVEGVWHIEAVHPSCNTVQEAINWRTYGDKNKVWSPICLS